VHRNNARITLLELINTGGIVQQLTTLIVTGTERIFFLISNRQGKFCFNKTIQFMNNESIKEEKSQITHAGILFNSTKC
jgi:hypothetical protein